MEVRGSDVPRLEFNFLQVLLPKMPESELTRLRLSLNNTTEHMR